MTIDSIDITPTPRLLRMLGEIELRPWQCIAEIIDNSFDNFLSNRESVLSPEVEIWISDDVNVRTLRISDNGTGMTLESLESALRAGYSTKSNFDNLGLFGMGFNIAIARLGDKTTVKTKIPGSNRSVTAVIDLYEMSRNNTFKVPISEEVDDSFQGGTEITIQLKPEVFDTMRSRQFIPQLRDILGQTYSYLLRDSVPGIAAEYGGAGCGFNVKVQGESVKPILPCVWRDSRSVVKSGVEVFAVQYIDKTLADRYACRECGHWQNQ
jgi:hypothetical protein